MIFLKSDFVLHRSKLETVVEKRHSSKKKMQRFVTIKRRFDFLSPQTIYKKKIYKKRKVVFTMNKAVLVCGTCILM